MASKWETALDHKKANAHDILTSAKRFYSKYGAWINRYRGGAPAGFLAAIAALESNGTMVDGHNELGEYGFYSVAKYTEKEFGLPEDFRKKPENNIFIAALEYNVEARRIQLKYPSLVVDGTKDQWLLARLVFAIGNYGTDVCIRGAIDHSEIVPGNLYEGILKWADETGAVAIGGSPAGKIWYRVHVNNDVNWPVGAAVTSQTVGIPSLPPGPGGIKYGLPKDVRGKIAEASSAVSLAMVAAAVLLLV